MLSFTDARLVLQTLSLTTYVFFVALDCGRRTRAHTTIWAR